MRLCDAAHQQILGRREPRRVNRSAHPDIPGVAGLTLIRVVPPEMECPADYKCTCPGFVDTPRLETEVFEMPQFGVPYRQEFRRQMLELVRSGRTPWDLSREFEPTAQSIWNWVCQAERYGSTHKDVGVTSAGRKERRSSDLRITACARSATSWHRRRPSDAYVRPRGRRPRSDLRSHERASQAEFPIAPMPRVLGVSVPGGHACRSRPASIHATSDAVLRHRIRKIHAAS